MTNKLKIEPLTPPSTPEALQQWMDRLGYDEMEAASRLKFKQKLTITRYLKGTTPIPGTTALACLAIEYLPIAR